MGGLNIGKIYPGMQSGTATLVAGSKVITFPREFNGIPNVVCAPLSEGTFVTTITPAGASATEFTAVSKEQILTGGSIVQAAGRNGTIAISEFNWLAFIDN